MRLLITLLFTAVFSNIIQASTVAQEKPVQHLKVSKVSSAEEAKRIFIEKTSEIKRLKNLDEDTLHKIHMITYTLEKSVEFFALNLDGDKQKLASEIAIVVEDIHINSENNRIEKTQKHLNTYFKLADAFITD